MEVHHCSKKHACLPLPKSRAGSSRRMDVTLLLTILLAQGLLLSLLEEAEASACESAKQFNRCRGEKGDEVLETGCAFTGQQEFPYGYQEHFPSKPQAVSDFSHDTRDCFRCHCSKGHCNKLLVSKRNVGNEGEGKIGSSLNMRVVVLCINVMG